ERPTRRRGAGEGYTFKGEDAVVSTIDFLSQGKAKPVVYFTQGNGELDLNDMDTSRPDRGLDALQERLQKGNYEAKGLQLVPVAVGKQDDPRKVISDKVPADAAVVVLPGPRRPLTAEALAALDEYMNREDPKTKAKTGKLVVMLDVVTNPDGTMVQTG